MRAAARYVPDEIGTASLMFSSQTHSENAYTTAVLEGIRDRFGEQHALLAEVDFLHLADFFIRALLRLLLGELYRDRLIRGGAQRFHPRAAPCRAA